MIELKKEAKEQVHFFLNMWNEKYPYREVKTKPIVDFKTRGTCGGKHWPTEKRLSFNQVLMKENWEDYKVNVIGHEVAHFIVYHVFGHEYTRAGRVRRHGNTWKMVMRYLGLEPDRTHSYDVSRARVKQVRRHEYVCKCRKHQISTTVHNRIKKGTPYLCNYCKTRLQSVYYPDLNVA